MTRVALASPLLLVVLACADLTAPSGAPRPAGDAGPTAVGAVATANPTPAPTPTPAPQPGGERIRASHILVAYQGAMRSTATRTKEEAKQRAEALLARARGGQDFAKLASENSDDPTAKARNGDLGAFERNAMVKPFADAAFALKPGEISGVVETPFGFHIIKRTE